MKFSCIRAKEDKNSFRFLQALGIDVYELEDLERTDEVLFDLMKNNYNQ